MKKQILATLVICALLCTGCSTKSNSSSEKDNSQSSSQTSVADVNLEELGQIATTSGGEWPSMYQPNDEEFLDYFGTSPTDEMFAQIYGAFCPMSAILTEVILAVPVSGREEDVQKFLDDRKALLIEKYAYYPSDKELAENAIIGNCGGVYYLICAQNASDAQSAIENHLS